MDKQFAQNGIVGGVTPGLKKHGASSPVVATTNAFNYKIDTVIYTALAAADLAALPATITVPLVSTTSVAVYVNAAGTASYVQGTTYLNTAITAGIYPTAGLPIEVPGKALIGYLIISCASTATFTGGTTNLDASNVTVTYLDKFGYIGL